MAENATRRTCELRRRSSRTARRSCGTSTHALMKIVLNSKIPAWAVLKFGRFVAQVCFGKVFFEPNLTVCEQTTKSLIKIASRRSVSVAHLQSVGFRQRSSFHFGYENAKAVFHTSAYADPKPSVVNFCNAHLAIQKKKKEACFGLFQLVTLLPRLC